MHRTSLLWWLQFKEPTIGWIDVCGLCRILQVEQTGKDQYTIHNNGRVPHYTCSGKKEVLWLPAGEHNEDQA